MQKTITLYENFRSLFYAPFYLAFEIGAFIEEGLSIEFGECAEPGKGAKASAGRHDALSWGGPMRALHFHDKDPFCEMVCFCEVVCRDPFYIVSNKKIKDFKLGDLQNITLGSFSEAVTPWLCLQDDCRQADIDPDTIARISTQTVSQNIKSWQNRSIGAVQLHEPFTEILIREGGHILYQQAHRGPCSYTSLYADRSMLDTRPDDMQAITNAMAKSLGWVHCHSGAEIASAVKPFFSEFSEEILASAIERYKKNGIWNKNTLLDVEGFERLRTALLSGGLIKRVIPYDEVVDTRFAIQT